MGLETGTYISDLNSSNPASGDAKSQGDDHLRFIKSTVKATFPNISGAVTPTHTQLNYVTGVTSAIQTQLDAKAPTASPTFTGTVVLPSTTSIGNVSSTELGYVDGVTSAIQTQLDAKAALASPALTGTPTAPTAAGGTNSTQIATTAFVAAAGNAIAWPLAANVSGADYQVSRVMLADSGYTFLDKGNSSTTTQTLDYTAGSHQKITATGNHTIATSNWPPTGNLGEILLELVNGAAYTITWPTINWIKSDGTTTTTFSSNGVTLQSSGTDFALLWSRDAGTTIYGKWVR